VPTVVLSAVFRLQIFIPIASLSSEGLDYVHLLAEIVTAQAVLITPCASTGKAMKHPPFSGIYILPDCFPLLPAPHHQQQGWELLL